jgi:Leucine-rich repeat (LRR) protein
LVPKFIINKFLSLELVNNETVINILGKEFIQCKALIVDLPNQELSNLSELTFDDLSMYSKSSERYVDKISPQELFWGHCSNLQAWTESGYNSDLIDSRLAFPLLKRLTEVGDLDAKKAFKEEIARRFSSGSPTVVRFLFKENYLDYLDRNELQVVLRELFSRNSLEPLKLVINESSSKLLKYVHSLPLLDELLDKMLTVAKDEHLSEEQEIFIYETVEKLISIQLKKILKDYVDFHFTRDHVTHQQYIIRIFFSRLDGNMVESLFGLRYLLRLREIIIENSVIPDFSFLQECQLTILRMNYCKLKGFDSLKDTPVLKEISCFRCELPEEYQFGNLSYLKELDLFGCSLNRIQGLESLGNLSYLRLESNQIQKIEGLSRLSSLSQLDLSSNKISKIEGLQGLKNLEELVLDSNQISRIENLENLVQLKELSLAYNLIEDISKVNILPNISVVDLTGNPLPKDTFHDYILQHRRHPDFVVNL